MPFTHKITYQHNRGIGASVSKQSVVTGDAEQNVNVDVPPDTTQEIDVAFLIANLQSAFIVVDHDVQILTNDDGTPDDTFDLESGKPLVWNTDSLTLNPFTVDVTKLFAITPDNGNTVNIQVYTLNDVTP